MKGLSLISGVLFMAFLIAATALIYWMAVPTLQKMQCSIVMDKMKTSFADLDAVIQKVASEGEGSKRTVYLNVEEGEIHVDGGNDTIYWTYECSSPVISPRTFQTFGNVIFGANLDTSAREGVCQGQSAFVLENDQLLVCLKKIGLPSNMTRYNISDVLLSIYQKSLNQTLPLEYLEITLDNNATSKVGNGYTALSRSGYHLPYAEVTAHMESDYGIIYDIKFILESGEDFLTLKGE
jgi:hypothetical protein